MPAKAKVNIGEHTATPADPGADAKLIIMAKSAAKEESLDPALVCAIVEQESNWQPATFRMELAFLDKHVRVLRQVMLPTEAIGRATSFGLMNIMGQVARELGFLNHFDSLCNPTVGLIWGCRHLSGIMRQVREEFKNRTISPASVSESVSEIDVIRETLNRWHSGSGGTNKKYADQVLSKVAAYR